MKTYSLAEARAHLPAILDEVESGADIELTRRGKPIAVVVARTKYRSPTDAPDFAHLYAEFLSRHPRKESELDRRFFASLRDSSRGRHVKL